MTTAGSDRTPSALARATSCIFGHRHDAHVAGRAGRSLHLIDNFLANVVAGVENLDLSDGRDDLLHVLKANRTIRG
jgi:hypothetical protein